MKVKLKVLFLFSIFALWVSAEPIVIDYKKAKSIYNAGTALWIDAREMKFYKRGTIMGAIDMPIKRFRRMKRFLPNKKNSKLVIFCNGFKCKKSDKLAKLIDKEGYKNILIYKGGYPEWNEKAQDIMGLLGECDNAKPKMKPTTIKGVEVYLGKEDGMIDANWFIEQFKKGLSGKIQLVDVRHESDFAEGHLQGAVHVPWDYDKGVIDSSAFPKDKLTLLYCNTGMQSSDAYDSLDDETAKRVLILNAVVKCEGKDCIIRANR